jgi:hypothetical protein
VSQIALRTAAPADAEARRTAPSGTASDRPSEGATVGRQARSWGRRHPDLGAVALVLAIGLILRFALLYRVPPLFMPGDSQSFLTPAYDLARGLGFDPILKRPLGYPLLLAGVIATLGEDLRGLVFVQALLGLVTVTATYWIGRLVFGRVAGTLAALTVAVGGQLLIYEHYVLAESAFAALLALAMLCLVSAARPGASNWRLAAAGGAALAGASLFRPIAELVVPLLPIYFLIAVRPRRRGLTLAVAAILAFVAAMAPAFVADLALRGGASSGALGEHLLWRITRSDSGYITRDDAPRGDGQTPDAVARRYVVRRAADRALPQEIFEGLRRELGLSPAQADAVLRAVALEAIGRQPGRYLASTLRMSVELFLGEDQQLGEVSKRAGEARYINSQARQRSWFEDRVLHLGEPPSSAVENEFDNAERLISFYQPGRVAWLIAVGSVVGGVLTAVSRRHRHGLILALAIPPLLLANAALAGPEARFRYPLDPLIAVVAAGGLVWLVQLVWSAARRRPAA